MSEANKERVQKVVDRMRLGDDPQIEGALRTAEGMCALGIFCDVYSQENNIPWTESNKNFFIHAESAFLPEEVAEWFGFEGEPRVAWGSDRRGILDLNDAEHLSFVEIADLIHKEFEL